MQDAKFYGIAPISLKSKIMVRNGAFDRDGTLLVGQMECLDTGIVWSGRLTPPGWRGIGIRRPKEARFPRFYLVEGVEINCATPETAFSLEEIPDPTAT